MRKNEKITALYERLSHDDFGKDDDQQRESNSISNQKAMLDVFAARQGFTNIVHFTDDGISGTCFDRPGFLAMMKEVEAGNVEYLCIKDKKSHYFPEDEWTIFENTHEPIIDQQTTEVRKQRTRLAAAKQRVSELEVQAENYSDFSHISQKLR